MPEYETIREVDEGPFYEYLRREFGFTPGLAQVRPFSIPEEGFAVYHLPRWYQEFLQDPASPTFDEEERGYLPGAIERWNTSGQCVLEWGNDFWLDATGAVVAT